jgi:hypothetical protein
MLQRVSVAEDCCCGRLGRGPRPFTNAIAYLACKISDESHETRLIRT